MDNNLYDRGEGTWAIGIYNPLIILGPFKGNLYASKDHYFIKKEDNFIVNIPSQNVSYCVNMSLCGKEWKQG